MQGVRPGPLGVTARRRRYLIAPLRALPKRKASSFWGVENVSRASTSNIELRTHSGQNVQAVFRDVADQVQDRLRRGEIPVNSKELHGISYAPLHMQGSRVSGPQHGFGRNVGGDSFASKITGACNCADTLLLPQL